MVKAHSQLMLFLLRLGDLAAAAAAWAAGYSLHRLGGRLGWLRAPEHQFLDLLPFLWISLVLTALVFSRLTLYQPQRTKSLLSEAYVVMQAVLLTWGVTYVIASFSTSWKLSRATLGLVLACWLLLAVGNRLAGRGVLRYLRRRGWNLRHAAVIGAGRLAQRLCHVIRQNPWTGIEILYFIDPARPRSDLLGLPVVHPANGLDSVLAGRPVDMVFVALPGRQYDDIDRALNDLAKTNVEVQMVPDLLGFHFLRRDVAQLADLPVVSLTHTPQHGWNCVAKRLFDIVGALAGLAVFAVPMLLVALLIKLTGRGPVFYSQVRAGLGGEPFRMLKFRTMPPGSEAATGPVWATDNDPRVTPLGRFLRRTSLDELPQFFNILVGQMSLVGPRPERPELIERFRQHIPRYMLRNQVKAGLTGWAQVHGLRGNTSLRKRVQYDLNYIANWSFGLDLRILLLSVFRGMIHPNAY